MENLNSVEWQAKEEDIKCLREWLKKQLHLPQNIPDEQLIQFLYSCYSKLEVTKKAIDTYYTMKTTTPEFFSNRHLDAPGLKHITDVVQMCILPGQTHNGYSVLWARLIDYDSSKFFLDDAIKLLFMVVDACLARDRTSAKGMIIVFDNKGNSLSHLARVSLASTKKYFIYVQEAMPVRLKSILIVNVNSVMTHLMNLIKPFMRKEYVKYILLHNPDQIEKTYSIVPKEIQPKDYGGEAPSMDTLSRDTLKQIRSNADWFQFDESLRIVESKKPTKTNNVYLEGSFKKLNID
ncbi:alpha-tocopherol transfer protein-like [Rhodnius prolixus]|uniref:CRAL-TRIO domain-containing protein n=1 Tax=Rhodnius prolixus TaxID=13249 RepID=T1HWT6_RHOPR